MFIFLIILFVIITAVIYFNNKESFENANVHIGNQISAYYYHYVMSILQKKDFIYETDLDFIKELPKKIKFNETLHKEFLKNGITYEMYKGYEDTAFWITENVQHEKVHQIMKPVMNKIMNDTFIKLGYKKDIKYPAIHFRCADTPFVKHTQYHFQKYSYFKKALDDIGNVKRVILLSCNTHLADERNKKSCRTYTSKIKDYLSDYDVDIQCNSNVDDFLTMFYAPAVISTTSSFSFMAGYFGNGLYIQPNMMIDGKEPCADCDSKYNNYNIPHSMVNDYHDIDEVYKLLI